MVPTGRLEGTRNPLNKSGTTAILCWNRAWLRRDLGQFNNLFRGFLGKSSNFHNYSFLYNPVFNIAKGMQ